MAPRATSSAAPPPVNRPLPRPEAASLPDDDATSTQPIAKGAWLRRARGGATMAGKTLAAMMTLAGSLWVGRAGHRWLHTTPRFAARNLQVTGIDHTRREDVLAAARLSPTRNLLSIDGDAAVRAIERLPWVAHARVERQLPDTVRVEVEEREAVALLASEGLYLVSATGDLFKRVETGDPTDLPVITGLSRGSFRDESDVAQERVRDALALLGDLEASTVGPRLAVEEVHCEPTGELSVMIDGTYVWLGRGPYRAKITRMRVVLGELRRRSMVASEVHLESERHPERVTVRAHAARTVAHR